MGGTWEDGRDWLLRAFAVAGRRAGEMEAILPPSAFTRRGQALRDLVMFDVAVEMLETCSADENVEIGSTRTALRTQKPLLHCYLDDLTGAIQEAHAAIIVFESLIRVEGRTELVDLLAQAYLNKANALQEQGARASAIELYDQALAILERSVHDEGRSDLADSLARAYLDKANALRAQSAPASD